MKVVIAALACMLFACAADPEDTGHDEPSDYEVDPDDGKGDGVSATFNQNDVVGDDVFLGQMTVAEVQKFFEQSPYKNRSWLADYSVNGVSAAQLVVDAASAEGVSPIMLIARMQVEASLVSKTARPTAFRIDRALGCGCPDGGGCSSSYRGFGPQLVCGAKTLKKWYDGSIGGKAEWVKGRST